MELTVSNIICVKKKTPQKKKKKSRIKGCISSWKGRGKKLKYSKLTFRKGKKTLHYHLFFFVLCYFISLLFFSRSFIVYQYEKLHHPRI